MSPVNLAFNGRFLCRPITGVDRFAEETLRALDRLLDQGEAPAWLGRCEVLAPAGARALGLKHIAQKQPPHRFNGALWEQVELPWHARKALLVSLCNTAPLLARQQVCAIHDAGTRRCPESYSRAFRAWYGFLMPVLGRRARSVLTVSAFARDDIVQVFRIPPHKVHVVSEGADHMGRFPVDESILHQHGLLGRPYVLAVSSQAPHKNFRLILDALADGEDLGFDVVIAGGGNARIFAQGSQKPAAANVKWVGYVSNEALRALYQHAAAFVFPSIYEGFGIPPLEAMHEGCPVIASRAASLPEICGDAALYIDPCSASDLRQAMQRVVCDPHLAAQLRSKGAQRVARFTWEQAARDVLEGISQALHGDAGRARASVASSGPLR